MGKAVEIAGQRFGRLLVLRRLPNRKNSAGNQESIWQVRCDCGAEKALRATDLRSGGVNSCGCLKRELRQLPVGVAAKNRVLNTYRQHAKQKKLVWGITRKMFDALVQGDCHYCGLPPSNISQHIDLNGSYIYNGIDRRDNALGYIEGNVVSCCKICNLMKRNLTEKEFLSQCARVAQR